MTAELSGIVVESSLRGGLVLALAGLLAIALKRRSGALRHAVWLAGIGGLLLAPLASFLLPPIAVPILPQETPTLMRSSMGPTANESAGAWIDSGNMAEGRMNAGRRSDPETFDPGAILLGTWLLGVLWLTLRSIRSHRLVAALVLESEPIQDRRLALQWRSAVEASGVSRSMTCRLHHGLRVPLVCGLRRPVLLLPQEAAGWDPAILGAVLAHEIAHLRRRDPLWLAVAHAARAIYWFHPLAWLAVRALRAESERACDDAVIRTGEKPSRYAETLLGFVASAAPEPAAALAFMRRGELEDRITGVLDPRRDRGALGRGERAWVIALALTGVVFLAAVQPVAVTTSRAASSTPKAEGADAIDERWTAKARSVEPTSARFRNRTDSPVRIRYAEVRNVEGAAPGSVGITMPELVIENRDPSRRLVALLMGFDLPTTRDRTWVDIAIAPAETARLELQSRQWSAVVPADDASQLTIHIAGARFDDGHSWRAAPSAPSGKPETSPKDAPAARGPSSGATPAPPAPDWADQKWPETKWPEQKDPKTQWPKTPMPDHQWPETAWPDAKDKVTPRAPDPAHAPKPPRDARKIPARIRNPERAPVVIVEALTPVHETPKPGEQPMTWLPDVKLENRSSKTVVSVRLRYKPNTDSHAVTGQDVRIAPHGSAVVHRDLETWGRPQDMTVQLLGVRFSDRTVWGTLDSSIDARDAWVYPLSPEGR